MNSTLKELAHLLGAKLVGDEACLIAKLATLDEASSGDISFLAEKSYLNLLLKTKASAVILQEQDLKLCPSNALVVANPRLALAKVAQYFAAKVAMPAPSVHPSVILGANCQLDSSASVGAYSQLGQAVHLAAKVRIGNHVSIGNNVHIGAGTEIKAGVVIHDDVQIGQGCCVKSGAVIGQNGFGFANDQGAWLKIPHFASVIIGNQVEIGNNTCIDRGLLSHTLIGNGVIIDNLVQIGHNVRIGAHTAIAACVAIAGSAQIGQNCMIGGCSSIAGHLSIVDKVQITATSSVNRSLLKAGTYSSGFPAKPNLSWRKNVARFQYLDKLHHRVKRLESQSPKINPALDTEND